jgi:CRP-like cAMP-binding protein
MPSPYLPSLYAYSQLFSTLTDTTWQAFSNLFSEQVLGKHTYFASAGKKEYHIGFLARGTVRSFYRDLQGVEYTKTFHVPSSFIGAYSSITSGQINQIYIQALEDSTLLVADYRKIMELYNQFPSLERLARKLAETYFMVKEQREIELVMMDASQRYEIFQKEFPGLENRIPQYYIASYLGITPTQLSRIRAKKR